MQTEQTKKPRFTFEDVLIAAQKRWRVTIDADRTRQLYDEDHCRIKPYYGAMVDDGQTTLTQATERMLEMLRHDGGTKNYILTKDELRERNLRMDALGFAKAFLAELRKGANIIGLNRIAGQQISLRKIQAPVYGLGESFIRYMKDQQKISLVSPRDGISNTAIWKLRDDARFSENDLVEMMKVVHSYFRVEQVHDTVVMA